MECTGIQENSAGILTKYIQYVSPSGTLLTRPPRILERLEKDPVEASIFLFSQPQHTHTHTNTDRQTWKGGELHLHEDM